MKWTSAPRAMTRTSARRSPGVTIDAGIGLPLGLVPRMAHGRSFDLAGRRLGQLLHRARERIDVFDRRVDVRRDAHALIVELLPRHVAARQSGDDDAVLVPEERRDLRR